MAKARSFLFPFTYSDKVAYIIEFSHLKIRFFAQNKLVQITGSNESGEDENRVLEIDSPYSYDDLWDNEELCCRIQTIQHSDILYIFNERYPIKMLKRYANDDWRLEDLELKNGPFLAMNTEEIMVESSALTGTVTLTAGGDIFKSTDVGRLMRLRVDNDDTLPWSAGKSFSINNICFSDNKYYQAITAGTTGSHKPVHSEGIKSDGGVRWKYLHDGAGIVRISEFIDAKKVQAVVLNRLPDGVKNGTLLWELGILHSGTAYPKSGAFFRNRFAFLINSENGPNVCLSCSGDYNNFADMEYGETTAETAITVPVLNTQFNEGKWIFAGDVLFVGTGAAEFFIDAVSSTSPMASDNVKISQISTVGSKAIMPVAIGAHILFADRYGLSLRDLMYNYYNEGYDQVDISLLGKHLFQSRIIAMCYQEVPDKVLWCLVGDGSLTALTFSAEQEVSALSRHDYFGTVESIAVIPNLGDCRDELWLEIKRVVNGRNMRTIEWQDNGMPQAIPFNTYHTSTRAERDEFERNYILQNASYLDAAYLFERDVDDNREVISGLDHLETMQVVLFADGCVLPPQVVVNGTVNIRKNDARVLIGLPITSQYVPQNIYIDSEEGSGIGQRQRINHVLLMLYLSGGGQIGENENSLSDILYRPTDGKMNYPYPLFSGNKEILFNGSTNIKEQSAEIFIQNKSPLPMNILAIVPHLDV